MILALFTTTSHDFTLAALALLADFIVWLERVFFLRSLDPLVRRRWFASEGLLIKSNTAMAAWMRFIVDTSVLFHGWGANECEYTAPFEQVWQCRWYSFFLTLQFAGLYLVCYYYCSLMWYCCSFLFYEKCGWWIKWANWRVKRTACNAIHVESLTKLQHENSNFPLQSSEKESNPRRNNTKATARELQFPTANAPDIEVSRILSTATGVRFIVLSIVEPTISMRDRTVSKSNWFWTSRLICIQNSSLKEEDRLVHWYDAVGEELRFALSEIASMHFVGEIIGARRMRFPTLYCEWSLLIVLCMVNPILYRVYDMPRRNKVVRSCSWYWNGRGNCPTLRGLTIFNENSSHELNNCSVWTR